MHGRLLIVLAVVTTLSTLAPAPSASSSDKFLAPASAADPGLPLPAGTVSSGAEPTMFVDKVNGQLLIGDTAGVHRSTNGGATWTHPSIGFVGGLFNDGRTIAQDSAGTLYAATTQGQLIGVASSTNHGLTWTVQNQAVAVNSIADRPWLAAKGPGEVALLWFGDADEQCAYSTDGGKTFLKQTVLGVPNAGNAVFDQAGRLWYSDGGAVHFWATACNGFDTDIPLPPSGAQIFTQMVVDPTQAIPDQYVAQPSTNNAQMLLRGHHGLNPVLPTWKDVVVSDPSIKSNTFGAIAIKSDGSEIAVAWYGSATPGNPSQTSYPSTATWNVYLARVTGFWTATPTVSVTTVATGNHKGYYCMGGVSCTGGRALLDYMGIAYAADGTVHVSYGADTSGVRVHHVAVAP